ncbi:hypothetical protein [Streptomyces sp. NPDC058664]|uniref:hypothetical protein n=1 Tax=unclassified Streptomyces TaxID=2593676 RepID=UPI00365AB235
MQSEPSSQDELRRQVEDAVYEFRERTALWGESDGVTQALAKEVARAITPKAEPEPIINNRCKCGHDRFRHCFGEVDGACSKPDCDCEAYVPVTVETVELPEVIEPVDIRPGCAVLHTDGKGNVVPCPDEAPAEPERRCNGCGHHGGEGCGCSAHAFVSREHCDRCMGTYLIKSVAALPPPEGPEYAPCVDCGHIEPEHAPDAGEGECWADGCPCQEYRPAAMCDCGHPQFEHSIYGCADDCACEAMYPTLPPQPERRPPLSVAYSVAGGHAYEVSIPGDASVTAEDGVLIIKHPEAQVLAIMRVAPMEGP